MTIQEFERDGPARLSTSTPRAVLFIVDWSNRMQEKPPLFDELSPEDLDIMVRHGIERTYQKNTVVISEGDTSDSLYIIREGRVKAYVSDEESKEITLNTQGPGEFFGELSLIDETERSASVMTTEKSTLVLVTRPGFERCLGENPDLAIKLVRLLVGRIRALTMNVKNLALLDVYGRVAKTLVELAVEEDGRQVIQQRMTHQDIANMVGSSREMVSRIMKELMVGGYLAVENKKIVIKSKLPAHW